MIPKLHKKGASFRGAATYLLHDKGAQTSRRVVWTKTRNLATENPHAAWRVMAATALEQDRLKREAGVKSTGRKSKNCVLHLTLSWHPDESENLTREEMMRAATGALNALKAQDHQVLCVHHDDEPQPHLHLLINRISPTDGRMLSSSNEKRVLSRWAEAYERERGEILCEQRALNNAARDRGVFTRGKKDKPRHIYELEAANENFPSAAQVREEQRLKDLAVRRRDLAQTKRHREEWRQLEADYQARRADVLAQTARDVTTAKQAAAAGFADVWRELYHEQEAERAAFVQREETRLGRTGNALRQIDWRGLMRSGRRGQTIRDAFGLLSSSGWRTDQLRRSQQRQAAALQDQERAAMDKAAASVLETRDDHLQDCRTHYDVARQELVLRHQMNEAALRAAWWERHKQRVAAWDELRAREPERAPRRPLGERGMQTTKADAETRSAAEQFMGRMRKAREERERGKGRDRDDRGR